MIQPEAVTDVWVTDICLSRDGSDSRQIICWAASPRSKETPFEYQVEMVLPDKREDS